MLLTMRLASSMVSTLAMSASALGARILEQFLEVILISKALDYNTSRANSVRANRGNSRRDSQHRDRSGPDSRTSRNGARHRRQWDPGANRLLPSRVTKVSASAPTATTKVASLLIEASQESVVRSFTMPTRGLEPAPYPAGRPNDDIDEQPCKFAPYT